MPLADTDAMPQRIGARYQVIEQLGRGGMAVVYRVRDVSRDSELALKQLLPPQNPARSRELTALFEREFYTLAQLSHPSVIQVYDYGLDVHGPYYSMELLDGGDLSTHAPLAFRTACRLMMQVCSSLSLLHSRRLVHRDISPRNVRCTHQGGAKLIDFGAMAAMGICEQSVGTPAFIAPEVVHSMALDARTDLFSLGATLYFSLTGRAPFAARVFAELREAWRHEPVPPSQVVPGIPPALDALVLSLLRIDPAERPRSAFEVMHRLAAIAGVVHAEPEVVSQAYLSRPTLVGRELEQRRFRQRMVRAMQGRGGGVLIEGAPGIGRSRLLESYVLEAKTLGATVLRLAGRAAASTPFAAAHDMAQQLLDALPEAATRCAREGDTARLLLVPVSEPSGEPSMSELLPLEQLPAERQALQAALTQWIHSVCLSHPILLLVDDVELVDEASLALLAGLAHGAADCPLLIVASTPTVNDVNTLPASGGSDDALPALKVLRSHCLSISLAALTHFQTEALFASVFGNLPHVGLVSDRIHKVAAGNPRESLALAQYLFDKQLLRYAEGSWLLPAELTLSDLPANAQEAFQARVAKLEPLARRLASTQALAVTSAWSRAEYAQLTRNGEEAHVDDALAALVRHGILMQDGRLYTLAHHGFQTALTTLLSAVDTVQIHLELANLCAGAQRPGLDEVHHLLLAGCPERALPRLATLLDELSDSGDFHENSGMDPKDIATTLELAHELAVASGRSTREIYELTRRLTMLSIITDHAPFHRHAAVWRARLERDSGLLDYRETADLGEALRRTAARYEATPEQERVYRPDEAIKYLARYVTVSIVIGARSRDMALLDSLPELLAPFAPLSPVLHALWQNAIAATEMHYKARNDFARQRLLGVYERLGQTAGGELRYVDSIRHAVAYAVGAIEIGLGLPSALGWIEIMDRDPQQQVNAMYLRRLLCLYEGDAEGAERHRKQAELLAVQASGRQMFGVPLHLELAAQVLARDLAGLKHVADRIAQLAAREPGWVPLHHLAQGWFQRLRGDAAAAKEAFERCLALTTPGRAAPPACLNTWVSATAGYVAVLVELGEPEQARAHGVWALERCAELGIDVWSYGIVRELALAEAKLNDFERAAGRLDALIDKQAGTSDSHLAVLYEARVHVAIWAKDSSAAAHFVELAARAYRRAPRAALLVGQGRLRDEARRAGLELELPASAFESSVLGSPDSASSSALRKQVTTALDRATTPPARSLRALELLCETSGARAGHLYLTQAHELVRAASCGSPADAALDAFANGYWLQQLDDSFLTAGLTQDSSALELLDGGSWTHPGGTLYRLLLLTAAFRGELVFVGVVALVAETVSPLPARVGKLGVVLCERLLELGVVRGVSPTSPHG
jgi:hypothetical protein